MERLEMRFQNENVNYMNGRARKKRKNKREKIKEEKINK